jgi:hypothetical protein
MATLAEMQGFVRDIGYAVVAGLDDAFWTSQNVVDYLNDALRDIVARVPDDLIPQLINQFAGTPVAAGVALPSDFLKPLRCENTTAGSATIKSCRLVSPAEGRMRVTGTPTGFDAHNTVYWIENVGTGASNYKIFVYPVTFASFNLYYLTIPVRLTGSATPSIPEPLQDAMPYYAVAKMLLKSREDGYRVFFELYLSKLSAFAAKFNRKLNFSSEPVFSATPGGA